MFRLRPAAKPLLFLWTKSLRRDTMTWQSSLVYRACILKGVEVASTALETFGAASEDIDCDIETRH